MNIDEIERRANAATPGPWKYCSGSGAIEGVNTLIVRGAWPNSGPFIARARADVPALIAEVRRLREVIHGMIGQCRFSCTSASHCRVCGTGYEAFNEP